MARADRGASTPALTDAIVLDGDADRPYSFVGFASVGDVVVGAEAKSGNLWRVAHDSGMLSLQPWGTPEPGGAPTVAIGAGPGTIGVITLRGRLLVYDSAGARVHVIGVRPADGQRVHGLVGLRDSSWVLLVSQYPNVTQRAGTSAFRVIARRYTTSGAATDVWSRSFTDAQTLLSGKFTLSAVGDTVDILASDPATLVRLHTPALDSARVLELQSVPQRRLSSEDRAEMEKQFAKLPQRVRALSKVPDTYPAVLGGFSYVGDRLLVSAAMNPTDVGVDLYCDQRFVGTALATPGLFATYFTERYLITVLESTDDARRLRLLPLSDSGLSCPKPTP
ncbi:MAG: hypothetical protein IT357_10580 [Gemmatimonadaceae bacterium]|nr:hypothetical protein [Gemmatimonadaceae bacterium]